MCAYFIPTHLETAMQDSLERLNRSEKLDYDRLRRVADEMNLKIKNLPEYMSGHGAVSFNLWDHPKFRDWLVSSSVSPLAKEISKDNPEFDTHVHYKFFVTRRGTWSFMFQKAVVEHIFSEAKRPGLLMTVEFFHESKALIFCQTIKNRYIGFVPPGSEPKEGRYDLIIVQPDSPVEKFAGISWSLLIREDM